ncbi:hypothetical protein HPP92_011731 [Vanilla planifolia]|uniref:Dirigent protein n=1 Tax=Vanilla planifolia TaxID=51239 RepID=A0A835R6M2_VANPL|nr:hypothetical protein HPP92_011731 [Vanilla planifolia]
MAFSTSFLLAAPIILAAVLVVKPSVIAEKEMNLRFFMHEYFKPPHATTIKVVSTTKNNRPEIGSFGDIYVLDNPLTSRGVVGSEILGRAQGIVAVTSITNDSYYVSLNVAFGKGGPWSGSSITVLGWYQEPIGEIPVVGGTGSFRDAKGYVVLQLVSFNLTSVVGLYEMDFSLLRN